MRTIKFRAWDKVLKNMHYVIGLTFSFDVRSISKVQLTLSRTNDITYCEVMQFTGLKDKNGKEIYEGDGNDIGLVRFIDGAFWFDLHDTNETFLLREVCDKHEFNKNIYEHPELLAQ